jgi:hypothetical protein
MEGAEAPARKFDIGGHFPAMERPNLLAGDVADSSARGGRDFRSDLPVKIKSPGSLPGLCVSIYGLNESSLASRSSPDGVVGM